MSHILFLNPVSTNIWNDITERYLKKKAHVGTKVFVENLIDGPESIESETDVVRAAPLVVEKVIEAEENGFDAVVINCFDDPGLHAARERASILVLGIGETSIIAALHLGYRFAIISTGEKSRVTYELKARELGVRERLAYSSGIPLRVLDLRTSEDRTKQALLEEARKAVENYDAEVIVLGCGGMIGLAEELSKELNVPVIDPTIATLKIAEGFLEMGLRHSKKFLYKFK